MELGQEIIHQQLFFRRELKERVYWFITLRWFAVGAGALGLGAAALLDLDIPLGPPAVIVLFILSYNLVFRAVGRRLEAAGPAEVSPFVVFAHAQISLDLFSLFLLIFFSGGLASPLLLFVIFHVILAGILLSPWSCHAYALVVVLALGGLIGLHQLGLVPVLDGRLFGSWLFYTPRLPEVLAPYLAFSSGLLVAAFLITSVKAALQHKGREVLRISRQLEESNAKLSSLYGMIKEIDAHTGLDRLMEAAVQNAARIMGVKACSIKLLDQERQCLRFAATYGLSEDYLSKDCIRIEESAINRQILEGSLYSIGDVEKADHFQYPENVRHEGIASMLCLPLKVESRILGVFCVYSGEPHFFTENDAGFFSLMTDLTALAMEKVRREETKLWFLNKAAHQLRSPLSAIQSMLGVVDGGYLGPISLRQKETVTRCLRRLSILQEVINDLLKLAVERKEAGAARFHAVDPGASIRTLASLYQVQAEEKGLRIEFKIQNGVPPVRGREDLIDELFSNLISNAIKYTPGGGRVEVELSYSPPSLILFEVRDTGIGISEEDQKRLFNEFFRSEAARAMEEGGTGLGLVIVKEILDRLEGGLQVESRVGEGTRISCRLPAAGPEAGLPEG
ncbi:MAG: GAF domain-containing sensor histidine kinase [Thermodesulfobacteriota bacterium]